jgi:uncharacterized protein YbjT (DUF2867 family)
MILVTGATGTAGSQVVRALLEQHVGVRAFVRDPGKARRLFGDAVELAHGDFADPGSLRAALHGVERLVLSGADDPRRVEWETGAIDLAVAAGVHRIVKLSSLAAEPGSPVAFWDWHGQIEQHLRSCGAPSVIVRSSFYMSNLLAGAEQVANEGRLYAPAGKARIAMIDPCDVGAVVAAVLTSDGHDGRTYVVTGPAAVTYAEVAEALSAVTRRPVEFVDVPEDDARRGMVEMGLPDFVARQICAVFAEARKGVASRATPAFEALTGRAPRDVGAFLREQASLFSPVAMGVGR